MKIVLRQFFLLGAIILALGLFIFLLLSLPSNGIEKRPDAVALEGKKIVEQWAKLSGSREGKVIYAQPPHMYIFYLHTGTVKKIPGVVTAGGPGRKQRGKTPRPSWSPGGKRFVYRYGNTVYVCDEEGNKTAVVNERMDCSHETRWSWHRENNEDWLLGPSKDENVILVKVSDPKVVKIIYSGKDVEKHCEVTGSGHVVYDNGSDIYVTPAYSGKRGIKISSGQSCRPCASPGNRAAWLTVPHYRYLLYDAATGKSSGALRAPEGEELYRLNWSNLPDFAVHMYGSRGNDKMHIRKINSGEALFIGYGWDPDLWIKR